MKWNGRSKNYWVHPQNVPTLGRGGLKNNRIQTREMTEYVRVTSCRMVYIYIMCC